jgi:hypothetical protein
MTSQRKTDLFGASQPGAQFVQLQVREVQVAEAVLVQALSVPACASEPRGDRGLTIAEDAPSRGSVQPFGEGSEDNGDLLGGGFQTVQRSVSSSAERGAASRASEGLDLLSLTMLAIAYQRVDVRIGVAEVPALVVGTSETFGVDADGGLLGDFSLQTRDVQEQMLALHPTREESRDDRRGNRLASGA